MLLSAVGLVLIASGLVHLVVFAVDGGPWDGPVSWRKPVTFGLSFGVTLIAVTWGTPMPRTSRACAETEWLHVDGVSAAVGKHLRICRR